MRSGLRLAVCALCAAFGLGAPAALAQSVAIAGLPNGFGLSGGALSLSMTAGFGPRRGIPPNTTRADASTAVLLGLGSPASGLGVELGATLTSFRNFGASGYLDLGFHRLFQINERGVGSVSLRVSHLAPWGDAARLDPGYTLAASYLTSAGSRLVMATLAAGTAFERTRGLRGAIGVGVSVSPQWSVSAGYSGDHSVLGATWTPRNAGATSVAISLNALEDPARRALVVGVTRSFRLTR